MAISSSPSWAGPKLRSVIRRIAEYLTFALITATTGCVSPDSADVAPEPMRDEIRVMTFNLEDIRTDDLLRPDHPRLIAAAVMIQRLQPDILLLNEIAYDQAGVPGFRSAPDGRNAQVFADSFISRQHVHELSALKYTAFMAPSNTGLASGFDLDRDGQAVLEYPAPPGAAEDGTPGAQTSAGRAYGNDNWGFGTFPGQYAMALLVRDGLTLDSGNIRTFQRFKWKDLADPRPPTHTESGEPWYDESIWDAFPLSSKSHWDVPVILESGRILHILASHPTPAAFDGPEKRNRLRNRAEIKFWGDYVSGQVVLDDQFRMQALAPDASFIILGDLNADPDEGSTIDDPVGTYLLSNPRVNASFTPVADDLDLEEYASLDADDTAAWGMRVDYVLPSVDIQIEGGAIVRTSIFGFRSVSDHFPVFLDITLE